MIRFSKHRWVPSSYWLMFKFCGIWQQSNLCIQWIVSHLILHWVTIESFNRHKLPSAVMITKIILPVNISTELQGIIFLDTNVSLRHCFSTLLSLRYMDFSFLNSEVCSRKRVNILKKSYNTLKYIHIFGIYVFVKNIESIMPRMWHKRWLCVVGNILLYNS